MTHVVQTMPEQTERYRRVPLGTIELWFLALI